MKLGGKRLSLSSSVKYLGVYLNENLSWFYHYNTLALKLRRANGILSKLRYYLSRKTLRTVYFALFHSHLSYATQVWGQNLPLNSRIFKLQKSAVRLITFSDYYAHSQPLFDTLNIPPLADIIFTLNVFLVYKTLNNLSPTYIQNSFNLTYLPNTHVTRGCSYKLLSIPSIRTLTYGTDSIHYQAIKNWNSLQKHFNSIDLTSLSLSRLKLFTCTFLQKNHNS